MKIKEFITEEKPENEFMRKRFKPTIDPEPTAVPKEKYKTFRLWSTIEEIEQAEKNGDTNKVQDLFQALHGRYSKDMEVDFNVTDYDAELYLIDNGKTYIGTGISNNSAEMDLINNLVNTFKLVASDSIDISKRRREIKDKQAKKDKINKNQNYRRFIKLSNMEKDDPESYKAFLDSENTRTKEYRSKMKTDDPEAYQKYLERRSKIRSYRYRQLKADDPEAYKAFLDSEKNKQRKRLANMKGDDPEAYAEYLKNSRNRIHKKISDMKANNPEAYKAYLEKEKNKKRKLRANMKANNPEAYKAYLNKANTKTKERLAKMKTDDPEAYQDHINRRKVTNNRYQDKMADMKANDPETYAAYRKKKNEYQRKRRAAQVKLQQKKKDK